MLLKLKKILLLYCLVLTGFSGFSQKNGLKEISGLPSKEVFDLLSDSKGFLWIATDLGLLRYDGNELTSFTNDLQIAPSVTDIIEDANGRIWCHNFNGQIFYVENEKMVLFKTYDAQLEEKFPRMLIYKDELIATSSKGLFVYNTKNKTARYIGLNGAGTTSLSICNNQVVAYGLGKWFSYKKGICKPLKVETPAINPHYFYLHPTNLNDTLLGNDAIAGQFYKLKLKGDTVKLISSSLQNNFINTIVANKGKVWVNTRKGSYSLNSKTLINNLNLSDVTTDRYGNTWYGSLTKGVLVHYGNDSFKKNDDLKTKSDEKIKCFAVINQLIAYGTLNGEVVLFDNELKKIVFQTYLPAKSGSIEKIHRYFNNDFIISTSTGNWVLNTAKRTIYQINSLVTKDVALYKNLFFSSNSVNFSVEVKPTSGFTYLAAKKLFPTLQENRADNILQIDGRTRAIKYDSLTNSIYVSLKNGLNKIDKNGSNPIKFNGKILSTSSLAYCGHIIFAGDFNRGLFIIDGNEVKNVSVKDGLLSNTILKLRVYGNHLWVIGKDGLQLFDIDKGKINQDLILPTLKQGIVYDIIEIGDFAMVATSTDVYQIDLRVKSEQVQLQNYLMNIVINGKKIGVTKNLELNSNQNNIQFILSAPWFNDAQDIYFKYKLTNNDEVDWSITDKGQSNINFASLMPGNYKFEAVASTFNSSVAAIPISIEFVINKPWWKQWWFITSIVLAFGVVGFFTVRLYFHFRINKERAAYERLAAVEEERQRISGEIHDDISAGLSALKLLTSLTEKKTADIKLKGELAKITNHISKLSLQLRVVIWTLSAEHNTLENLVYYLQQQAVSFFENSDIKLLLHMPGDIVNAKVTGEVRKHIYLASKEAFQNVIKHAEATAVDFTMRITTDKFIIIIADNGIGMQYSKTVESMGISNMQKRITVSGGEFSIEQNIGTVVRFEIPLNT